MRCKSCGQIIIKPADHANGACLNDSRFWKLAYVYMDKDGALWVVKRLKGGTRYVQAGISLDTLQEIAGTKLLTDWFGATAEALTAQPGYVQRYASMKPKGWSFSYWTLCKRDGYWPLRCLEVEPKFNAMHDLNKTVAEWMFLLDGATWTLLTYHAPWQHVLWGDRTFVMPELPPKPPMGGRDPFALPGSDEPPVVSFSYLAR